MIGRLLLLIFLLIVAPSCARAGELQIERQEISIRLIPEQHLLAGRTTLTAAWPDSDIELHLAASSSIDKVEADDREIPFRFDKGLLVIDRPAGRHQLVVSYHSSFKDPVPEKPVNDEDPSFGVSGTITSQGVFLGGEAGWYPAPEATPKQRLITISAPPGMEAITSGRRISHSSDRSATSSSWQEEHPVGVPSISAGPYQLREGQVGETRLYTYLYADNSELSGRYLEAAAKYIRFYSELIGPYPFEKFAVVENFLPTGYGFPSYTLLGSAVIRLPFIIDTSLPHEICHNWWGNGVLADYVRGNWSEGLVTYLADYLLKERKGEGRDARWQMLADYATLVQPANDFPVAEFKSRVGPASRSIGYSKAAMVFHMLRKQVGDDLFFQTLQEVFRKQKFSTANWNDFIQAFSRLGGKDLSTFAAQWLKHPGGPQLKLEDVTRRRVGSLWEVTGAIRQNGGQYLLPVALRLKTADAFQDQLINITGERTRFRFTTIAPPERLLLDPKVDTFRLLNEDELPPTVNRLKASDKLVAVITDNCRAKPEAIELLLKSLGQKVQIVQEKAVGDASQQDLLLCGVPKNKRLLGELPGQIEISSRNFRFDGTEFHHSNDLLFLVGKRPGGAASALFMPLSENAAEQYAFKITHYGKYSYLIFSNGENRGKGNVHPSAQTSSVVLK